MGHLIGAKAFVSAGELLVDKGFISKRVNKLGSVPATRRHVLDLMELRRELLKADGDRSSPNDDSHPPVSSASSQITSNNNAAENADAANSNHPQSSNKDDVPVESSS